jgi:hypothetical protein
VKRIHAPSSAARVVRYLYNFDELKSSLQCTEVIFFGQAVDHTHACWCEFMHVCLFLYANKFNEEVKV